MMNSTFARVAPFSTFVLRVGLATVIVWFGSNQLLSPDMWTAWVPTWTSALGLDAAQVVFLNGLFEVAAGLLLLLGVYTRYVALVLFAHMMVIVYDIGLTAIGVRDFGIAIALLALAFDDRNRFTLVN